jgi:hypothetical protein
LALAFSSAVGMELRPQDASESAATATKIARNSGKRGEGVIPVILIRSGCITQVIR